MNPDCFTIGVEATPEGVRLAITVVNADSEPQAFDLILDFPTARILASRVTAAVGDGFHRTGARATRLPHSLYAHTDPASVGQDDQGES